MREYLKNHVSLWPFFVALVLSFLWLIFVYEGPLNRLFITADQAGYHYYKQKEYSKAVSAFENQSFKGAAYFRSGEFKKAKAVYQNDNTKNGKYNLGNAAVMLGDYDTAIEAYEVALKMEPHFEEAKINLEVAKARKILKEPENDGKQGIGDMYDMQPDEIVYDNTEGKGEDDTRSAEKESASGNPNWLDRLQTGPKDFLKNKFYYQVEMRKREGGKVNEK